MPPQIITVNSRKYDLSIRRSWTCALIEQKDRMLVLVGEFDQDVEHPGLGAIRRGTLSYEYYYFDRWYNIFRFHEPDGSLRNYYCNVAMPPTFGDGILDYVDLDIDIIVWPDNKYEVVDREDFERNAVEYGYPKEVRQTVESSIEKLREMIEQSEFPFAQS